MRLQLLFIFVLVIPLAGRCKPIDKADSLIVFKIFALNNLKELKMSYRTVLKNDGKIEALDLSGLELDTLPNDMVNLKSLKRIDLRGNNFKTIPAVINKMDNVKEIEWKQGEVDITVRENKPKHVVKTHKKKAKKRQHHPLHLGKKHFIYFHLFSGIIGTIEYLTYDINDEEHLSWLYYITLEKLLSDNMALNINFSLEWFDTYPAGKLPTAKKELSFGYGFMAGVRYYLFERKFFYTGINCAYFQLPDNYRPYRDNNDQLSYYYSMGVAIGNKFSITEKISAFIEFGLFPFIHNHIIPGPPVYDADYGRFPFGAISEDIIIGFFESGLLPYKGLEINLGIGMGF